MSQSLHQLTDVCGRIAERLKDSQWIKEISLKERNFMPYIRAYPWGASSLSHGYPGLVILFSEMDVFSLINNGNILHINILLIFYKK